MNIKRVPISEVIPWEKNPRNIMKNDFERLKRQIEKLGVYKPLVCVQENGGYTVLGGNMRLRALQEMGIKEVEISIVKAETEAEKIEYSLSDNDRMGMYMEDQLAELVYPHIEEINLEDFKVDLGEAINMKQVVERFGPDIDDGADEVPEIDDTPAITKMGDLFTLGKHRLLCGDSTKAEDVARLMRGEKADSSITDPPYNVGVDYNNNQSDQQELYEYKKFSALWFHLARANSKTLIFTPGRGRELINLHMWFEIERPFDMAIWIKKNSTTHGSLAHFMAWEALLVYGKPLQRIKQDVYDYPIINQFSDGMALNKLHPTPKRLDPWCNLVEDFSGDGDVMYEPFSGSGTTLIAAEKTGRVCVGLEIDPKYCDVIIKRYANYVGISENEIRVTVEHG